MKKLFLLFLMSALLLSGCINLGGTPAKNDTNVTPPIVVPVAKPTLSITSPMDGEVQYATGTSADVDVQLSTTNLAIKASGTAAKAGEGHFRLSLDGGAYVSFYSKTYTLSGVELGNHTLSVEIVNNDNTAYSPAIKKTVSFEVKSSAPLEYTPQNYTVEIKDFSFTPASTSAKVGDRITWVNKGSSPHSATSSGNFDTQIISPGSSTTLTMTKEGTFDYFSLTYMAMKGKVVVGSNSTVNN